MRMQAVDDPFRDPIEEPASRRLPTISIIENSKTTVAKSMDARASLAPTIPNATIKTAPMIAAPGRSLFIKGNLPTAKTT